MNGENGENFVSQFNSIYIESTSPIEALQYALNAGSEQDVIWVGGSLFVVGNVLRDAPRQIEGWP